MAELAVGLVHYPIIDRAGSTIATNPATMLALALIWLLFQNPAITLLSVAWVIGFWAIVSGVLMLMLAFRLKRHRDEGAKTGGTPAKEAPAA